MRVRYSLFFNSEQHIGQREWMSGNRKNLLLKMKKIKQSHCVFISEIIDLQRYLLSVKIVRGQIFLFLKAYMLVRYVANLGLSDCSSWQRCCRTINFETISKISLGSAGGVSCVLQLRSLVVRKFLRSVFHILLHRFKRV